MTRRAAAAEVVRTDTSGREGMPAYVWFLTLFIPVTMLSGRYDDVGLPVPVDRLLFAAGVGLLLLTPEAWRLLRFTWIHALLLAATAAVVVSAATAGTLTESGPAFALLDRYVVPFTLFAVAPVVWRTPARRDLLLKVLLTMGVYLGTTGILEFVAPQLVFPRYIVDESVGIQFGRARGPFVASEAMGLVLVMTGTACAVAAARFRGGWRLLALVGVLTCVVSVTLTLTRSVWLVTVLTMVFVFVADRRVRLPMIGLLAAAAVAGSVLLAAAPTLAESFTERATTSRSLYDRANTNAAALRIVADQPLTGLGWQRFTRDGVDYVRQADDYPITTVRIEVHNVPLSRAAETGLPAALVYVAAVLASLVVPLLRRGAGDLEGWRLVATSGVIAWGVAAMLSPVPYPTANYLVWLLAGLVAAPLVLRSPAAAGARRRTAAQPAGRPFRPFPGRR